MKSKILFLIVIICFSTASIFLSGCKSDDSVKPSTSPPITTLSDYYASVAKVDISKIIYDPITDSFSISGHAVISHKDLLEHYEVSLTGRIQ